MIQKIWVSLGLCILKVTMRQSYTRGLKTRFSKTGGSANFKHHFYLFFKSFYLFILLYNIVLVLPYIDLNPPWVYMCSPF